jgi:TM2 domain-containing membrane protein YozV
MLRAEHSTQSVAFPLHVASVSGSVVVIANQKSSGLAAVLSFFWCGLGQIYNGEILKGVGLMIAYPVCLWLGWVLAIFGFLFAVGSTTPNQEAAAGGTTLLGIAAGILAACTWLYGMINAYRMADKINQRQMSATR